MNHPVVCPSLGKGGVTRLTPHSEIVKEAKEKQFLFLFRLLLFASGH